MGIHLIIKYASTQTIHMIYKYVKQNNVPNTIIMTLSNNRTNSKQMQNILFESTGYALLQKKDANLIHMFRQ